MFYECMMLSPVDKVFEFNDKAIFYNMVITREYIDDDPLIIRVIRKNNIAVIVVKELENDSFKIPDQIIKRFHFKKAMSNLPGNTSLRVNDRSKSIRPSDSSLDSSIMQDPEIEKGEMGQIIIQKMKTIKQQKNEDVSIDYILFWLSNEGLKRIENLITDRLLNEVNTITDQSRNLGVNSKLEFLQKMDIFQSLYIGAQNAKESKRNYFRKIIQSDLPSLEFR